MKICPMVAEFHADRRTDGRTDGHDEALRNVSKASNGITGIGWEGMGWVDVAQDKDKWRVVVKMVLNLRVTQNTGNVLPG